MTWCLLKLLAFVCIPFLCFGKLHSKGSSFKSHKSTPDVITSGNNNSSSSNASSKGEADKLLYEYYTGWSKWSRCSRRCYQTRVRRCKKEEYCGKSWLKERRVCRKRKSPGRCLSYKIIGSRRRTRLIQHILYDTLYSSWSNWGPCTRSCQKRRHRTCNSPRLCGNSYIQEEKKCRIKGTLCEKRYTLNTLEPIESPIKHRHEKEKNKTINGRPIAKNGQNNVPSPTVEELRSKCGVRPAIRSGSYRIVGGREVQKYSWPWQVAIFTRFKEQYCGGTLIAPQWVLTAAHCVRKRGRKRKFIIRVREHNIDDYEGKEIDLKISKDFPHPDFDYEKITNDIAILKLKRPVSGPGIDFACLPESNDMLPDKTQCYALGWGKEKSTHLFGSDVLRQAKVPVVNRARCQRAFNYTITKTQVCAGYKRGGIDSCGGDSGGPLICPRTFNGTERWYLYGVTSYGEGCGQKGKYGIYTNVPSYVSWIHSIVDTN